MVPRRWRPYAMPYTVGKIKNDNQGRRVLLLEKPKVKKSTGESNSTNWWQRRVIFIEGVFYNSAALEANANDDTECGSSNGNRISKAIIDYLMEVPGRVKHIGVNDVVTCSPKTIEEV